MVYCCAGYCNTHVLRYGQFKLVLLVWLHPMGVQQSCCHSLHGRSHDWCVDDLLHAVQCTWYGLLSAASSCVSFGMRLMSQQSMIASTPHQLRDLLVDLISMHQPPTVPARIVLLFDADLCTAAIACGNGTAG